MARLERIASHDGIVKAVREGIVDVEIASTSACASCEAHAKCGFAESKNKTVGVPTAEWNTFEKGEKVTVNIDQSRGMLAVWIAYVLPVLVMLAAIIALSAAGAAESLVAVAAIAILSLYVAILYFLRRKIEKKFTLTILKTTN